MVHRTTRTLDRRYLVAAFATVILMLVSSHAARADVATFGPGAPGQEDVPAGASFTYSYNLYICGAGAPNVVFENAETFTPGETVTATLTPVVWPVGSGMVELTGATSVVGVIPAGWPLDCSTFGPEVSFRYTAPSATELGCDEHPGDRTFVYPGAHVDFVGDAGTRAHTDAGVPGGLGHEADIPVGVRCPAAASTPTPAPTDPLAGGSVRFRLDSYRQQGEELLALVGTEFHVAVTNGGPNTAVVSTGADGQVSFDVTVTAGHATASIEITEIARSDYPFLGASCGHDNLPLLDWTDRPHLTLELEPGWNAGCWFYHAPPGASPRPTSAPTLPPTDTDAVVTAAGSPALPVVLLLLAISAALPLRRLQRHRAAATDIES